MLAEVIGDSWVETVGETVGALRVSREEALADPDLRMCVFAWEAGDDSAFERFDAQETAEREAYIAQEEKELKARQAAGRPDLRALD